MGLRFAAGTDALAVLVRERQDLSVLWRDRDKALIEALSKPHGQQNPNTIDALHRALAATEGKLAANTARLERELLPDQGPTTAECTCRWPPAMCSDLPWCGR